MKYRINGKEYTYSSNVRNNDHIRLSFDQLSSTVFDLSFENWYRNGYWDNDYVPHVLINEDNQVVANVSVNIMHILYHGRPKTCLQLGTVMTHADYRHQGLSKWLMERVFEEWQGRYETMYLYANDSVLDFYPKFGFVKAYEYRHRTRSLQRRTGKVRQLDMQMESDRQLLNDQYTLNNPYSVLSVIGNKGLLMFYCTQLMSEHIYYLADFNAVAVVEYHGDTMMCHDIFCADGYNMTDILSVLMKDNTTEIILGFTPKDFTGFQSFLLREEDTTLMILDNPENFFPGNQIQFPSLSHT
ncbi:GNAT family N-acetyltransferase [Chitinophaga sp. HK235]|uniref:GNAT family N-acetyltransferase n=1 Tax=Chitinophaga sp. HK235 TaxID=2952571 RepID=UPI001BA5FAAB|nr:GNAT family N-acetyltransferase [Chitinophaga sp. HK235]